MSTQLLDESLSCARAKARSLAISVKSHAPTVNPLEMLASGQSIFSATRSQGVAEAEKRYKHFKGRFAAAAKVLVQRIVGQAIMVAKLKSKASKNSIQKRWEAGIKTELPSFLKGIDPSRLSILDNHELIDVINNPNDVMVRATLWSQTLQNLLITGRAFWMLTEVNGRKQILPMPTTWVTPDHTNGLFSSWNVKPPGSTKEPVPVPAEFMAHFYFPDPENPLRALSPLDQQSGGVLIDEAIQTAQQAGFKNGIHPTVAIIAGDVTTGDGETRPVQLTPTQRNQMINWMRQQYGDVQRFGTPIILDALIRDIKPLSTKPLEMAFLESSNVAESLVYMGLGVNPIAAGKVEDVNRASSALADQHLVNNATNPIIEMMSQTINKWVVPFFDKSGTIKAWIEPAEPHDPLLQLERAEIGLKYQCITRNEYRRDIMNLPPLTDGDSVPMPVTTQIFPTEEEKGFRLDGHRRLAFINGDSRRNGDS